MNPQNKAPYNSRVVADYILNSLPEKTVTPMKLLKLVYIAHGWYLAIKDRPLIKETVQAWQYGPVIPAVYYQYKEYGKNYIPVSGRYAGEMSDEDETFVSKVVNVYKQLDGLQLSALTHESDTPWHKTIQTNSQGEVHHGLTISEDVIKEYYKELQSRIQSGVSAD